jgi:hypothetical protein
MCQVYKRASLLGHTLRSDRFYCRPTPSVPQYQSGCSKRVAHYGHQIQELFTNLHVQKVTLVEVCVCFLFFCRVSVRIVFHSRAKFKDFYSLYRLLASL